MCMAHFSIYSECLLFKKNNVKIVMFVADVISMNSIEFVRRINRYYIEKVHTVLFRWA